jgi:drug/metabolite transporter (DMT)-like permease
VRHADVSTEAILLIVGSVLCFTLLDTITKFTTRLYPVPVLIWARFAVQFLAMLVWLGPSMGTRLLRTRRLPMQLIRALVMLLSSFMFVSALRVLPLADATAINYSTPVLVILLAVVFLHERMTLARGLFVVAGIAGMLLIVQPGSDVFQGGSLYAIGGACCYGTYQILTRKLAGENPRVLLFYPALMGTIVMTVLAPAFDWPEHMPWQHVALIVLGGLLGTLGHFLFILAFQHGPASALTPFTYMQLVWATLLGWFVYGDFPDVLTLIGMAIIALSGLLITLHERRRARYPIEAVTVN